MFYVYVYKDPDTLQPFYVGKGQKNRFLFHLNERKNDSCNQRKIDRIQTIIDSGKYPIIEKVRYFDDEEEAYAFEEALIKKYGRIGFDDNGILTNINPNAKPPLCLGRDPWNKGLTFGPMDEITKQKISTGNTGLTRTEETKEKIRQANLGKKKSKETRDKMSKNMKGRIPWNKGKTGLQKSWKRQACVFISPDGNEYTFDSQKQGCEHFNLPQSKMSNVLTGKIDNYHGWKGYKLS